MKQQLNFLRLCALLFHIIQHAIVGSMLAFWAAKASGLPDSDWSLEPLLYIVLGLIAGPLSFLMFFNAKQGDNESKSSMTPYLLPYLISFLVGYFGYKWNHWDYRKNTQQLQTSSTSIYYDDCYQKLRNDPQIVIREGWYKMNDSRVTAYRDSLIKNDIAYTPKMLERLTVLDDRGRTSLYQHEKMSIDFLESELRTAIAEHNIGLTSLAKIQAIVKNPQAKQSWRIMLEESGIKIP